MKQALLSANFREPNLCKIALALFSVLMCFFQVLSIKRLRCAFGPKGYTNITSGELHAVRRNPRYKLPSNQRPEGATAGEDDLHLIILAKKECFRDDFAWVVVPSGRWLGGAAYRR